MIQLAILAGGVVLAVLLLGWLLVSNYIKVPPNEVAVFTGAGRQRTVTGGAAIRIPGLQRVDRMSLEPFNVVAAARAVLSKDGVPVDVEAVASVKFGSETTALATAVERFLTTDREDIRKQVTEMLTGNLRNIVSQMTVEELNGDRDGFTRRVREEAESSYGVIGMVLDVLSIQNIADANGYLAALGRKRIAEVVAAAEIGEAEAKRGATIKAAVAEQEGRRAQAEAQAQIAESERDRDVRVAEARSATEAANATAAQAGPLAEARAQVEVARAEAETARIREEANIAVEQQRALRAAEAQRADVIIPAEAKKQADVIVAEGAKQARVLQSEAELAEARNQAEALKLDAEAQRELAEALAQFNDPALRAQALPKIIEQLPVLVQAMAEQLGQIDRLVVIDGGGSGQESDPLSRLLNGGPQAIAKALEQVGAMTGINLTEILQAKVPSLSETSATTTPVQA